MNGEKRSQLDSARALRGLVDEMRAERAPDLDFDAIERDLFVRIDARADEAGAPHALGGPPLWAPVEEHCLQDEPTPLEEAAVEEAAVEEAAVEHEMAPAAAVRKAGGWGRAGWVLAAAAALALAVPAALESPEPAAPIVVRDLASLGDGEVVEAIGGPVSFGVAGRVTWTLEEGGRLVVQDDVAGAQHVVALERGSIRAHVTPRPPASDAKVIESFAVEVGETRVAVRGTVFSVTRAGPGLIVDVERGAVAVGKLGSSGLTEGSLVLASERAAFSLDGGKNARRLARSSVSSDAPRLSTPLAVAGASGHPASADATASDPHMSSDDRAGGSSPAGVASPGIADAGAGTLVPSSSPPPAASGGAVGGSSPPGATAKGAPSPSGGGPSSAGSPPSTLTVDQVRVGLMSCFAQVYEGQGEAVQLSVSTVFHLSVEPDGSIQSARFVPPLKPEMAECAGRLIAGRFDRGPQQLQIPIQFQTPAPRD